MNSSPETLKGEIERLAEVAGVDVQTLLKVAGLLQIAKLLLSPVAVARPQQIQQTQQKLEMQVIGVLASEPVIPLSQLEKSLGVAGEPLRRAVEELEKKGFVHTAENSLGLLVAAESDGTLRLSSLSDEDRKRVIINWYANRYKNISYADVHRINRQVLDRIRQERGRRKAKSKVKERILSALKSGVKGRAELLALGIKESTLDWNLNSLLKEGRIVRASKGQYRLSP